MERKKEPWSLVCKRNLSCMFSKWLDRLGLIFPFFWQKCAEGFPEDLSIVATLRPAKGVNSVLFAVYNDAGDEQLVVSVGKNLTLHYYEGEEEGAKSPPLQVDFGVRINDGKSVTLAY